jgi:hypothetical protein
MTARRRRVSALLLLSACALLVAFAGCARQGEGQRCDATANGDKDCASGLVCIRETELQQPGADRCCPRDGQQINVSTCTRRGSIGTGGTGGTSTGGTGGTGGTAGSDAGTGGASTGGTGGASTGGTGGASTGGTGGASTGGTGGASDAGMG